MNRSSEVQNLTAVRKKKGIILRPAVGRQDCSPPVTRNHLRREAINGARPRPHQHERATHQSLSETLNNKSQSGSRLGKPPSRAKARHPPQTGTEQVETPTPTPHGPLHSFQWVHAAETLPCGSCRRALPCACSCLASRRAKLLVAEEEGGKVTHSEADPVLGVAPPPSIGYGPDAVLAGRPGAHRSTWCPDCPPAGTRG